MDRYVDIKEISDGRLYGSNDMVKADCGDCRGCYDCCCGMGESIVLDPLDIHRLSQGLGKTFDELLKENLELNVVDGLILPNLKMQGEKESCSFLTEEGRCSIHSIRPGICRLFPLGRFYENGSFQYFLQVHECKKENRAKIKVKKWIDTPNLKTYEKFVKEWHFFLKGLQERAEQDEEDARALSLFILRQFYSRPYDEKGDFYLEFEQRLNAAKTMQGICQ
ncbi:MAG: YkgJ family cysteine cluster protein [Lachnospiraceae bacterium]|nr:YkgJ family cysteine cluster protein [Lachnospiraceae bacterium]